jgi:hypothetical protein
MKCFKCSHRLDSVHVLYGYDLCYECFRGINNMVEALIQWIIQPERSKREDSQKCEMRCSEHCGNTVRDK